MGTATTAARKAAKKSIVDQSMPRNVQVETAKTSATSAKKWVTRKVTVGENIQRNDPIG